MELASIHAVVESWRAALDASESRFHAIVNNSLDGVLVIDQSGAIHFSNPAAAQILDCSAEQLCGREFGIPLAVGDVAELNVCRRGETARIVELRITETVWRQCPAFLVTLRDITERKRREEECREAIRRRDEFLAMLSHELRNPLAAVSNAAHVLLRQQRADLNSQRACEVIDRETRQMVRLLDDLLDVCRISCGKTVLRKAQVDLALLVAETAEVVAAMMESRGLTLHVAVPETPVWIEGDAVRLRQVVHNLLSNAAKYTAAGGRVRLTLDAQPHRALLTVADTGSGISADDLPHIFDPFYQGRAARQRGEAGLGVGLSLVRSLVQMHGGEVEARSPGPGAGTTFEVRLPRPVEIRLPQAPAAAAPASPVVAPQPAPAANLRLLVVEDNPHGREMMKMLLEMEGYEVVAAADGETALELISLHRPDVALVDLGLPGIDGCEVARRIRANSEFDPLFLIAVTGYGQAEDVRRSLAAGFDIHLVKPLDPEKLVQMLNDRPQRRAATNSRLLETAGGR